jgi:pimeloyl-ACP methyl ester carboxylesterase
MVPAPMAPVTEHHDTLNDQPLFWRSAEGGEPPVLYLHGVPTSSDDWVGFLARTGGLAPDLPGFGRSGKRGDGDFTMRGYDRFVEDFLDHAEVERVRLVVHDWGVVGLLWAQRHPERVERLVVIDAVPLLPGYRWHRVARLWRMRGVGEVAVGLATRWAWRRALPQPMADESWPHFDQGTQRAILRLHRSIEPAGLAQIGAGLDALAQPALILWGECDPWLDPGFADAYAQRLAHAHAEPVPGAGHWPWLDQPAVIERVASFLAETQSR